MKLEVGKTYMDWNGESVTIISHDDSDNTYEGDDRVYYMKDGCLYGYEELFLSEFEESQIFDPISELHAGNKVIWHTATEDGDDVDYVVSIRSEDDCKWLLIDGEEQDDDLTNECHRELVLSPGQFEEYVEPDEIELVDGEWYWVALSKTEVVPALWESDKLHYGEGVFDKNNVLVISHIYKPEFV